MAGHLFQFPAGGSYSASLLLNPALVVVQTESITPIQRVTETEDGKIWVVQLSGSRRQTFEVTVVDLPDADFVGTSGYTSLKAFIQSTLNYSESPCDFTHDNIGAVTTVRYMGGLEGFREAEGIARIKGRWSGRLVFQKVL